MLNEVTITLTIAELNALIPIVLRAQDDIMLDDLTPDGERQKAQWYAEIYRKLITA